MDIFIWMSFFKDKDYIKKVFFSFMQQKHNITQFKLKKMTDLICITEKCQYLGLKFT